MWVPPETKDPVLLHYPPCRSVGYFGAVRLRDGKFRFSRETGKFNAMTFFAFLKMLRRTSIRTGHSVVILAAEQCQVRNGSEILSIRFRKPIEQDARRVKWFGGPSCSRQ